MKPKKASMPLVVFFVIVFFTACESREDRSPKAETQGTQVAALAPDLQGLLALLPESNAIPGWTRGAEVRFFKPDNLFEYIDGAAENYLIYGFLEVVTTEYSNPQQSSPAVVEVYRMKDPRNAFGIYASELNPDSEFKKIGAEGYIGGTALNFWSGPYYAKITVFDESDGLKQEMEKFAIHLDNNMGATSDALPEIGGFPSKNQIPHSMRYLPKDVLGQAYLTEGFEARYKQGNSESKIVISTPGGIEDAKEALARYRQFTAASGKVLRDLTSPGDGGFAGQDSYYGNMAAIRSGNRIIIALGGPSTDYALSQASACLEAKK